MSCLKIKVCTDISASVSPEVHSMVIKLKAALDGRYIDEGDIRTLRGLLADLTEQPDIMSVTVSRHYEKERVQERISVTLDAGAGETYTLAVCVDETEDYEASSIAEIKLDFALSMLYDDESVTRLRFLSAVPGEMRNAVELLDTYLGPRVSTYDPSLLKDFKTSTDIADDLSSMLVIDQSFITGYMMANGYRAKAVSDGTLRWQIWRVPHG